MPAKSDKSSASGRGVGKLGNLPGYGLNRQQYENLAGNNDERRVQNHKQAKLIPVDRIEPNPDQPRKVFDLEREEELAQDIGGRGIINPITVRIIEKPGSEHDFYQIVAGERRWRAFQRAMQLENSVVADGLMPAIIREVDDSQLVFYALVENLQRENLAPDEEGETFLTLQNKHNLSQTEIARLINKSVSYISRKIKEAEDMRANRTSDKNQPTVNSTVAIEEPISTTSRAKRSGEQIKGLAGDWERVFKVVEKTGKSLTRGKIDDATRAHLVESLNTLEQQITQLRKQLN